MKRKRLDIHELVNEYKKHVQEVEVSFNSIVDSLDISDEIKKQLRHDREFMKALIINKNWEYTLQEYVNRRKKRDGTYTFGVFQREIDFEFFQIFKDKNEQTDILFTE